MGEPMSRLLCIDLQVDPAIGLEPDAHAIFGARQLLTMGRRLGWTIAHARRRASAAASHQDAGDARVGAMRPLKSEQVFFRSSRSILESPSLSALLESWRGETVFVAAFDHVALLSCLLACYEHGPRLVLVEDVLSLRALTGKTSIDAFRTAAWHLAAGSTTIASILAAERRPAMELLTAPVGEIHRNMPV
jgi:hypothetical protein